MVEPKTVKADKSKPKSEPGISLNRIRTIMKSTADTGMIMTEGLFVMTKATEYFIQYLSKKSYGIAKSDSVAYEHLSKLVDEEDKLEFLTQIIPKKIKVKEFKAIVANKNKSDYENSSSSSDEEGDKDNKIVKKKLDVK